MNLTFNGKHSLDDMGLKMKSDRRHILPEPKLAYEDLPGVDGEYDFTEVNPDGRTKYKPFTDHIRFTMIEPDSKAVRTKAKEIAKWLSCGEKVLVYEDDPDVYYLARVVNQLDIESQLVRVKSFTAQFKGGPYGYGFNLVTETVENIITAVDCIVDNPGEYVKPTIKITGSFTTLTVTLGSETLTYNAAISGAELVIDCDEMSCIKDGSINMSDKLSGYFFALENGSNTIQIDGTGLSCDVEVSFRPRYL